MNTKQNKERVTRTDRPGGGGLGRRIAVGAVVLALSALVVAVSIDVGSAQSDTGGQAVTPGPMGGSVLDVPMVPSGATEIGGIEVIGSHVDMGRVPLDVTVVPTWTLTNNTTEAVMIGQPHASVIEGCCPGPLTVGTNLLAPGASTEIQFPLQMHRGMDGPHDFTIHVPVGDASEILELGVTGDFRA